MLDAYQACQAYSREVAFRAAGSLEVVRQAVFGQEAVRRVDVEWEAWLRAAVEWEAWRQGGVPEDDTPAVGDWAGDDNAVDANNYNARAGRTAQFPRPLR